MYKLKKKPKPKNKTNQNQSPFPANKDDTHMHPAPFRVTPNTHNSCLALQTHLTVYPFYELGT